jgi:hypothetical protein
MVAGSRSINPDAVHTIRNHHRMNADPKGAGTTMSTNWLAFLAASAIAPAAPAIAAAAPRIHLTPAQVRLSHTQAQFTKAQLAQMQRNIAALNRKLQTHQDPNPQAAQTFAQGRSRSSRRRTRAPAPTFRVTCSSAPTATFNQTTSTDPNGNIAITAHYDLLTACLGGLANQGEPNLGGAGVRIYETATLLPPNGSQSSSAITDGVDYAYATGSAQGPKGRWQNPTQVTMALPPADVWTSAAADGPCVGLHTSMITCYTNNQYAITPP